MAEAAKTSQPPGARAKPLTYKDLEVAANARAELLLGAFKKEKKTDPSPKQLEEMAAALNILKMMNFRVCSDQIGVLAEKPQNEYDVKSELQRMCVAFYFVKTLEDVRKVVEERGDSASYTLFLEAFRSARKALSFDFFFYDGEWDLAKRFMEVQPSLDACAKAFGTTSYDINQAIEHFMFPLMREVQNVRNQKKQ